MKVLELKGFKSLRAMNAFHALMLGLKMLPDYMAVSYEDFFAKVTEMSPADQERLIREAALFVQLQKEEVESLICFVADPNGVPYSAENLNNLGPQQIHECIVSVAKEIAKIKIDLVTPAEKKN